MPRYNRHCVPHARVPGSIGDMNDIAEILRRLDNLIRLGTIAGVDPLTKRCRVKTGGLLTGWLRWFAIRAGEDRDWDPPSRGEQCIVFSPSGDPEVGIVFYGFYSDAFPAPDESLTRRRRTYRDGAIVDYDTEQHLLRAVLPDSGRAEIIATGGLHIVGPITHEGDYTQTGNQTINGKSTVSDDVVAAGISLTKHRHPGDSGGMTGGPQ